MKSNLKIYVAGHTGMVGSACLRALKLKGYKKLVYKKSSELDLTNQKSVKNFIEIEKPDIVINCAAVVGGILANNNYPYKFLMDNMLIQNNLIRYSHENKIKKFVFLGSSCIYPKYSKQPIKEKYLLSDYLEPTNEWYAIAKISGVKLIESLRKKHKRDYISLMPTNLYGSNDNFDFNSSHVIPGMIAKFHQAKIRNSNYITLWGDGTPLREFLHVDDLANAILFSIENSFSDSLFNVGSGEEIAIKDLAKIIKKIVGFKGGINWDKSMPNGTPRKLLDSTKFKNLGWKQKISLENGIDFTYKWYVDNLS